MDFDSLISSIGISNVLIIVFLFFVMFYLLKGNYNLGETKNKNIQENFDEEDNSSYFEESEYENNLTNESWDEEESTGHGNYVLNNNFVEMQFHNDYRDVITAINNLVPRKKQFFNLANYPVVNSNPEVSEIRDLIDNFVNVLNDNIMQEVPNSRNKNSGWDEAITDLTQESGWEKQRRELGLATSLYNPPAKRAPVVLIEVLHVKKQETDDEIKYICILVLQKTNVNDQISLRCSFIQDKRELNDENNFFIDHDVTMKIMIEEIGIIGYYSNEGLDNNMLSDNNKEELYYDYDRMEYNNMTDPRHIQKVLMDNYKKRNREMNNRTALLDEEGQLFHQSLPHLYDYSNIQGTQTIFDDMNMNRSQVFGNNQ